MAENQDTVVKVKVPRGPRAKKIVAAVKDKRIKSIIRKAHDFEINLVSPKEFFKDMSKPVESRLYSFMKEVQEKSEEQLDTEGHSKIIEYDLASGKWRWRKVSTTAELKSLIESNTKAHSTFMKLREAQYNRMIRGKEDSYGGYGFGSDGGNSMGALQTRQEFTPLIGTPFYKQMYLYDYWEMHSKCFWYSNYSAIAKLIIDMTRNFVLGKGFSVSFDDEKCDEAWKRYCDRVDIQEEIKNANDDLTKFGENMIKIVPTGKGLISHRSFDPSTIWEIVTDPENIHDIKYYHQQYNTQYQLYGTKDAPISKYIIQQLPPELVRHTRVNVTAYEKRGRSDLLGPLLYFKYYEDYIQAKLARAKNEAAFIWDVTIDGSDEDVNAYISSTESIVDVPPGSENVHNKAITRTPLSPTFGKAGGDQIAQDILSYIAMGVSIPVNYFGTFGTSGSTKAGSLVATEPVAKKMVERQTKLEGLIRRIVKDVLMSEGLDPKSKFEVNFPEILEEDRSQKIQDLLVAQQEKVISHERFAEITAKELKISDYDYKAEQKQIEKESKSMALIPDPSESGLTPEDDGKDNGENQAKKRAMDRTDIRDKGKQF